MMCVTPSPIRTVTVGFGISPNLHCVLAGFTAGGELHPALRSTERTIAINVHNHNDRNIHIWPISNEIIRCAAHVFKSEHSNAGDRLR